MKHYAYVPAIALCVAFLALSTWIASAQSINPFRPVQGGTGTSSIPTYGQMLVGNSSGTYSLMSTSSLGIVGAADGAYSTTSADYWKSVRNFFSTTSVDYWETTQAPRGGTAPVGTSTVPTGGHLAVWTSNGYPSLLGSVATGTLSGSGGVSVSANRYVIGGAATVLCATATGSNQGCLSASDWTTFNAKESALTVTYPLTRSVNTIVLAFGTTTSNIWAGLQTFTNSSTTAASFSYASSTLQYGAGLSTCESGNFLTWSSGKFGCAEDQTTAGSSSFSTTSANYWETQQTSRAADDITDDYLTDLFDVEPVTDEYGRILIYTGTVWDDIATSSLGINFSDIVGTVTDAQVPDTISLTNITQITNRAISDTTGTLAANRGGTGTSTSALYGQLLHWNGTNWQGLSTSSLALAISDTTGTLAIGRGGTGLTSVGASSTMLLSNGSAALWQLIHFPGISGLLNLASQVTGTLAVGSGGTGATTLNNLITLATHTTGDFIATITGTANEITVSGSGGENAAVTLSLPSAIDLGGKTSFEVPNGIAPTVNTTGQIGVDTSSPGQLVWSYNGATVGVTVPYSSRVAGHATSTWNGTTTQLLGPAPGAITVTSARCETNSGTVGVSLYDGTNRANFMSASTTIGDFSFSTNNTFTLGESMRVDFGTPASSPQQIACTFFFTYTRQ